MLSRFLPYEKRRNIGGLMGFGLTSHSEEGDDHLARPIPGKTGGIDGEQTVVWRPLSSGILNCGKILPGMLLGGSGLSITLSIPTAGEIVRDHSTDSTDFYFKETSEGNGRTIHTADFGEAAGQGLEKLSKRCIAKETPFLIDVPYGLGGKTDQRVHRPVLGLPKFRKARATVRPANPRRL